MKFEKSVLGSVLDRVIAFVGTLTPTGVLTEANAPALEAAGITRDDVIGKPFWECFWWSHCPRTQDQLRDAVTRVAAGETVRYDVEIRIAGDQRMIIDFMLAPQRDDNGAIVQLIPSGVDITQRKHVENELRRTNAMLDAIFEGAPVGIGLWDRDLRFLRVNQRLADINGFPPARHVGMRPDEMLPDIEGIDAIMAEWRRVIETGEPMLDVEVTGATPAAPHKRYWKEHFFPVRVGETVIGLGAVVDEITDDKIVEERLREREARLRSVFATIDEGYCLCEIVVDGKGRPIDYRFLEVNPLFERMTGLADAEGRTVMELVPDIERHWIDTYARVALGGETLRFENESGAMGRTFDVFAAPAGPGGRFALVFKDITERKEAEAHRELLLAELNHRVRNSLANIQAIATQTMRHAETMDAFRAAFLGRLRAIAAAHDILFNSGERRATLSSLIEKQVRPYVDNTEGRLRLSGPNVELSATVAHGLGLVLHELATNAVKYGALSNASGHVHVDWRLRAVQGDKALEIDWVEHGGPPVAPPRRAGFGSELIESALSHSLGGDAELLYKPSGLTARLIVPLGE